MKTYETAAALGADVTRWKDAGEIVSFVPTMGNLHGGHLALVDLARARADRVSSSSASTARSTPHRDGRHRPV